MTIAQASRQYGLTADTLRYYERIGIIPPVARTAGGIRDYTETDGKWIDFAKCMRSAGLPIEAIIEYVALYREGERTYDARRALLAEQRKQLALRIDELQATLNRLDEKIERYDKGLIKSTL